MMTSDHPQSNSAGPATYIAFSARASPQTHAHVPSSSSVLLHSAKLPDWPPFTSKRVLFPSVRMWNTKAPGHAGPLHRWKHTNYVGAMTAVFFWVTYFPRPNKNPGLYCCQSKRGDESQFGQSQQSITARRDGAGGKSGKRPTWREWLSVGKEATGGDQLETRVDVWREKKKKRVDEGVIMHETQVVS